MSAFREDQGLARDEVVLFPGEGTEADIVEVSRPEQVDHGQQLATNAVDQITTLEIARRRQ